MLFKILFLCVNEIQVRLESIIIQGLINICNLSAIHHFVLTVNDTCGLWTYLLLIILICHLILIKLNKKELINNLLKKINY